MNERIQKLAIQAGLYVDLFGKPWPRAMSAEECEAAYSKFSQLIVQECAGIARNANLEDVEGGDSSVLYAASEQIKEHFGVE
jgi:hypothetical protein